MAELPENPTQGQVMAWLREMEKDDRYWVKADVPEAEWTEVTRGEFVNAERQAGFYPKPGCGDLATAGFMGSGVRGTITSPAPDGTPAGEPRTG